MADTTDQDIEDQLIDRVTERIRGRWGQVPGDVDILIADVVMGLLNNRDVVTYSHHMAALADSDETGRSLWRREKTRADRHRQALEQISEHGPRQGSIMLDIARRALNGDGE